jgi:hypothetical protein
MNPTMAGQPSPTAPLSLEVLEAQPILERKTDNIWMRAQQARDAMFEAFQHVCQREFLNALVLKSGPFVHPMWVKFECWIPMHGRLVTERVSIVVTIEAKPFHQYEWVYNIDINDRGKPKKYVGLWRFNANDARQLVQYLLRRGTEPNLNSLQLRQAGFEFWKPANEIKALKFDWLGLLPLGLVILGVLTLPIGVGVVLLIGAAVAYAFLQQRQAAVRSSGRPEGEPRDLLRVDSWQAVISGLGPDGATLRARFLKALEVPVTQNFRHCVERIWYWGLEGKEEREQLVLTLGRGILFCQIHQYNQELYVGWDAHLNRGQWVEQTVTKGLDREANCLIHVNTVVPGRQFVTEYDLHDLNCLIEWAHAKLTKIVKELMEERKIDQEIDFKIQRGERQNLTGGTEAAEGGGEKPRGVRQMLERSPLGALKRTA